MTVKNDEARDAELEDSISGLVRDLYEAETVVREEAARQIWLRFADRLAGEVRRRLNPRIYRRESPEDVVQSLFASFFIAPPPADGPPRNREQLWRLLVHFTICKVANTAKYHRAACRNELRDGPFPEFDGSSTRLELEPQDRRAIDPADAAVANEEFHRLRDLVPLKHDLRRVFDLRVQGYTNAEIAVRIERSERMVELKMKTIRAVLRPHIAEVAALRDNEPERSSSRSSNHHD